MFKSRNFFLSFIISVVVFVAICILRFYQLGNIPQGLTQDEAYYLYDGYSILKTGKDLWGNHLPLMFRSTGEYKLNLTYLIASSIKIAGLNATAARLPSAIAGVITLLVLAWIIYEITKNKVISFISVLIFSLSPWNFGISRLFYESNVGLCLLSISLLSGLIIIKNNNQSLKWWLLLTSSSALSAYFYGAFRYLGLGLVLLVTFIEWYKNKHFTRFNLLGVICYVLIMIPIASQIFSPEGLMRLSQESKLHQFGYELVINEARSNCYLTSNKNLTFSKLCYVFWNKPVLFVEQFGRTTARLLSPEYLFFTSVDTYIVPEIYGAYLPYLIPIYLIGLLSFISLLLSGDKGILFLGGALSGSLLLVSSIGEVAYHRNVLGLFIVMIIISLGLNTIATWFKSHQISRVIFILIIFITTLLGIYQTTKYVIYYFTNHAIRNPLLFKYDASDIYKFLNTKKEYTIYDNIFFSPIFAGIYWKLDPTDFQKNAKWAIPDKWGFSNAEKWNNLHFKGAGLYDLLCIKHKNPSKLVNTLLVDDASGNYFPDASYVSHDFTGSLDLHAVYDIDKIYEVAKTKFPNDLCKL